MRVRFRTDISDQFAGFSLTASIGENKLGSVRVCVLLVVVWYSDSGKWFLCVPIYIHDCHFYTGYSTFI